MRSENSDVYMNCWEPLGFQQALPQAAVLLSICTYCILFISNTLRTSTSGISHDIQTFLPLNDPIPPSLLDLLSHVLRQDHTFPVKPPLLCGLSRMAAARPCYQTYYAPRISGVSRIPYDALHVLYEKQRVMSVLSMVTLTYVNYSDVLADGLTSIPTTPIYTINREHVLHCAAIPRTQATLGRSGYLRC